MANNKTNLLASLTGDDINNNKEQDLFGDIPNGEEEEGLFGNISLHDDPLQQQQQNGGSVNVNQTAMVPTPVTSNQTVPQQQAPAPAPSLLAGSGLLLSGEEASGDGLFDAVDEELEEKKQQEAQRLAQEQQKQQEQLRLQKEEQERAAQQELLEQQMQQQQQAFSPSGFYRNHQEPPPQAQQQPQYNGNLQYSTAGGPVQSHSVRRPTTTAGMHAAGSTSNIHPPSRVIRAPKSTTTSPYISIKVEEPMLVASNSFLGVMSTPPHWTYQVTTTLREGGTWLVRRRFRHVPALEERLRQECPGSILPPRPDKHATRAIEEASTSQSAEFALQRAQEMQIYLNELAQHPVACSSNVVRLFLALQDDLGTAWPEVSSNTLTRLSAVGAGAAVVLAESTSLPGIIVKGSESAYEDNAELLALASSEELRMGAVTQAVPKLEGSVTLLKEHGESCGAVGMELSKLAKEMEISDGELSLPLGILSSGLLRAGRREKRLAMELSAAMSSFVTQYKLCKNERLAFQDRRHALAKCQKERAKADERAQKLLLNPSGEYNTDRVEREAVMGDTLAMNAVRHAEEIGITLKEEVNRVAYGRRTEWSKSMKVVASAMKEASSERVAIWESTRESFLQAFPDMSSLSAADNTSVTSGRTA